MNGCYAALGRDPVPGDPDAVDALVRRCRTGATALGDSADRLRRLAGVPTWQGEAAQAAADRLGRLADRLDGAAAVLHRLGGELAQWSGVLLDAQDRAWRLERAARSAQLRLPDDAAADELAALRRQADRLALAARDDAERAVRAVRAAAADAPAPTWLQRRQAELDRWVLDDVRTVARVVADPRGFADRNERLLDGVALVAGGLTLAVGGPAGLALAGVALGATVLQATAGDAGPLEVALAGAGVLTGGLAVGAGRLAAGARGSAEAWDVVRMQSDAVGKGMTVGGFASLLPVPAAPTAPPRRTRPVAGPRRPPPLPLLPGPVDGGPFPAPPSAGVPRPVEFGPPPSVVQKP